MAWSTKKHAEGEEGGDFPRTELGFATKSPTQTRGTRRFSERLRDVVKDLHRFTCAAAYALPLSLPSAPLHSRRQTRGAPSVTRVTTPAFFALFSLFRCHVGRPVSGFADFRVEGKDRQRQVPIVCVCVRGEEGELPPILLSS